MLGIIPAAGEGTRLYPWIRAGPKELIMYGHQPVIMHCLETFKECGIENVCIVTGHKKGALMDYVGDGDLAGVHVDYTYQVERRGLGHALLCAEKRVQANNSRSFAVILGDTVIEPTSQVKRMIDIHEKNFPFATILLERVDDPSRYGVARIASVKNNKGDIIDLYEKPDQDARKPFELDGKYLAIAGAYVLTTGIFDYLREVEPGYGGEIQLTDALRLAMQKGEHIIGVILEGKRRDFGNWYGYLKMQKEFFMSKSDEELMEIARRMDAMAEKFRNGGTAGNHA